MYASADAFVAAGAHLVADMCMASGVHICIVQPLAVKILSAVRRKKVSIKLYHQTFDMACNKKAADRKIFLSAAFNIFENMHIYVRQ